MTLYGAWPVQAMEVSREDWNQPRCWSLPSKYKSHGRGRPLSCRTGVRQQNVVTRRDYWWGTWNLFWDQIRTFVFGICMFHVCSYLLHVYSCLFMFVCIFVTTCAPWAARIKPYVHGIRALPITQTESTQIMLITLQLGIVYESCMATCRPCSVNLQGGSLRVSQGKSVANT